MSYLPDHPEQSEWDVVVVGTGMGGSTVGYDLAKAGWRVLFLEKGLYLLGEADRGDGRSIDSNNQPEARLRRGLWPQPIQGRTTFGNVDVFASPGSPGCGSGGSTNLFGSQLERFAPCDFRPKENFPDNDASSVPETWPITYDDILPFYRQAESLYRVCGTPDPLNIDKEWELREPPALSPQDQDIYNSFCSLGLHPYRSHVGFEYVPDCEECPGVLCPRACKNDAGRICLLPALEQLGAKIITRCEVLRLEANSSKIQRVRCCWNGNELAVSAKIVILAAGALMTPILLLNSMSDAWPNGLANSSGMVGRNLMFHASDVFAIKPIIFKSTKGPQKALSFNDFYVRHGKKYGTVQSASGVSIANQNFRGSAAFATILEDLPYSYNRVFVDPNAKNGMRFEYYSPSELQERIQLFRQYLWKTLDPNYQIQMLSGENTINYVHACGTCRFGNDPENSVLDKNNLAHGIDNLYVVDGSFFPSSGGTNPALTITANALRVAKVIHKQLSK